MLGAFFAPTTRKTLQVQKNLQGLFYAPHSVRKLFTGFISAAFTD